MSFLIHIDEHVDAAQWKRLLAESNYASPFQTKPFYDFCNAAPGYEAHVYAVANQEGVYHALCVATIQREKGMKSYFSRRAVIYGGLLLNETNGNEATALLLETLWNHIKKKIIFIEIRNFHDYGDHAQVFKKMNWEYVPHLNIKVNLSHEKIDDLMATFKYNRRREIKLTRKAGITSKIAENENEISTVYDILYSLYHERIRLPLPPLQFFIDFWKSGIMKAFVVADKDKVVGGAFCPFFEGKAIYTFYYCGIRDYKPKTYPTHLAVMAALEYGMDNNLEFLDFMGAGKPDEVYGVRQYKMEFGGTLVEEGRYRKVANNALYALGKRVVEWKKRRDQNRWINGIW